MTTEPTYLYPDTTVQEAATTMKAIKVGFLPVGDGYRLLGVITDRDIALRVCGKGRVSAATRVEQVMTPDVIYAYEDQEVEEAVRMLDDYDIRRLIILNRDKRLTGILSLADLAREPDDSSQKAVVLEGVS